MSDMHHEEKKYSIFQIAMNLTIACLISGVIISGVYYFTHPLAVKNAEMLLKQSMRELVADADDFKPVEGHENWYAAEKGGETVAYLVPGEAKGYGGAVKVMVAVSNDGDIIDFSVTKANETPGLGTKAFEDDFRSQYWGKSSDTLIVTKDPKNTENIQAITGATITSRAVTEAVKEAVDAVLEFTGGE